MALVHARPYQPAGKGKIERFFRTLRAGWLNHLDPQALDSLQTLNRSLWAWIEGEYHNSPHRGIEGRTPLEQWALASAGVRYPDATLDLDEIFLFEARRLVHKDRTVSLNGRLYEVDPLLVGQKVILRYDPDAPPSRPLDVVHDGKPAGKASQRLVVRHHLTGLDRDEVDAYLKHRLRLAGCELPLFEAPAVEALFQSARGLPRQINRIAHYALSAAALDKARTVNAEHLQHALDELRP